MPNAISKRRLAGAVLTIIALAAGSGLAIPGTTSAEETLTIRAGGGEPGFAVNEFLPGLIRINTGDTLHFETDWFEPHTVTFGQPTGDPTVPTHPGGGIIDFDGTGFVSSGFVPGPSEGVLDIRFTKPGTYNYFCALHPLMTGVVEVTDTGSAHSQATADARGNAEYNSAIIALKAVADSLSGVPTAIDKAPDGGTVSGVQAAGESFGGDVMQFFQPAITIHAGDTVKWTNPNGAPHNIVFGPPQPADPFEFTGSDVSGGWDGTGGVQSPMLGQFFSGLTEWSLTFTRPGVYSYICILHADQGMAGTVTVLEAAGPGAGPTPKPPQTGTGEGAAGGYGGLPVVAGGVVLMAVIVLAGTGLTGVRRTGR